MGLSLGSLLRRRRDAALVVSPLGLVAPPPPPRLDVRPTPRAGAPLVNVAAVVGEALDGAAVPDHVAVARARARHVAFAATDAAALREAIRALAGAAVEAMPAGGELRVALARQGAHVVVELSDSGAPLETCAALERARALLARCGAQLARTSVPGRGNRSRVLFPAPEPPPLHAPAPARASIDHAGAGR